MTVKLLFILLLLVIAGIILFIGGIRERSLPLIIISVILLVMPFIAYFALLFLVSCM